MLIMQLPTVGVTATRLLYDLYCIVLYVGNLHGPMGEFGGGSNGYKRQCTWETKEKGTGEGLGRVWLRNSLRLDRLINEYNNVQLCEKNSKCLYFIPSCTSYTSAVFGFSYVPINEHYVHVPGVPLLAAKLIDGSG